jgi:hypothetical protein
MSADAETLAKALDWANRELALHPAMGKWKVAEEAAKKFDLGPLDEEWLLNQLTKGAREE